MHPPKTNGPAKGPDPGEEYRNRHFSTSADLKTERIEVI
jgi:hypothetical protein